MAKNLLQNLIDSGIQFGEVQRKQADKVVKRLVKTGEVQRKEAERTAKALVEKGKETTASVAEIVQREVAKQLGWIAERFDDVEDQLEAVARRIADGGREVASDVSDAAAPAVAAVKRATGVGTPAKKAPAKRAPAKKAAAKKAPAKKAAATKAPAKKTAAKKAPAKKAAGTKTAARKAPAKKTAAAKAPASSPAPASTDS